MREWFEYGVAKTLLAFSRILPQSLLYALFEGLATLYYYIDSKRRELTKENLQHAGFSPSLALQSYCEIAKSLTEMLLIFTGRFDFTKIKGEFKLKSSKPKIFVTAHFGNWEALAHYMAQQGYPMAVVGREGNNKLIERNITTPFRQLYGNKLVYKEGAMRKLIASLKKGENIGLLIDQKAGNDGIDTTFFGRRCKTVPTIAMLAKRFDVEVVPIFLAREKDGFKIIQKEFSCEGCDIKEFTQKLNDIIEEVVREYPTQWFWMHNRWKLG
ncbi:lysophospholipid acyltransferase family protein [Nitratiruptor tergarcus]|uniref:KDO2-lipid IV(A) lauroyltransferase n=1 Tax=Nitratiruptor tergarcus DSM 16512 TaxID=1069081 RepID=A0A1W1WV43_9BACT|nr:lysophospholipid acyltransferase family protein [Nitratiruptor tergarcus]SMC10147.1 KDO2-lipid IV(A) lauroyltransferase [Nitratiruptor tergarcus DSM 16512]